jgi:antitoxin component HigA of HigAB toxin-antitoxin module
MRGLSTFIPKRRLPTQRKINGRTWKEHGMQLKLIRTRKDYRAALAEAERLWDAPAGSEQADQLDVLTLLIANYERAHFAIDDPDPIDFLLHVMEARGLSSNDLEPDPGLLQV